MSQGIEGDRKVVGRFAPSPTGAIHAGNIFAALNAWLVAKSQGGRMVMRIEDLDRERSKQCYIGDLLRDFESLGLTWDEGPYFQSGRQEAYEEAFRRLEGMGLVYPCFCSRADLLAQSAPHGMGEKQVYSGRCKGLSEQEVRSLTEQRAQEGRHPAFRLAVGDETIEFVDLYQERFGQKLDEECGDFLVKRSDGGFAYQLAVVVDDAEQGVNSVVRGYDLLVSTPQQIYLQQALGLPAAEYAHFPLFCAPDGRRLAKRNAAASYKELLSRLGSPEAVVGHVAYIGGLQEQDEPTTPEKLLETFSIDRQSALYEGRISYEFDIC